MQEVRGNEMDDQSMISQKPENPNELVDKMGFVMKWNARMDKDKDSNQERELIKRLIQPPMKEQPRN